jgi:group I intron endonuclease
VGSSVNFKTRFTRYYNDNHLRDPKSKMKINRALKKYGRSNFELQILEYCDVAVTLKREQHYMELLKPNYNINPTAGSLLGFKHSEETKAAMRLINLGVKFSEETKAKMRGPRESVTGNKHGMFGKTHTVEAKAKIGSSRLGRKHSMDAINKIRANSPLSLCVEVTDKETNETREYRFYAANSTIPKYKPWDNKKLYKKW